MKKHEAKLEIARLNARAAQELGNALGKLATILAPFIHTSMEHAHEERMARIGVDKERVAVEWAKMETDCEIARGRHNLDVLRFEHEHARSHVGDDPPVSAPKQTDEEIAKACANGKQQCSICRQWECCDNTNPLKRFNATPATPPGGHF